MVGGARLALQNPPFRVYIASLLRGKEKIDLVLGTRLDHQYVGFGGAGRRIIGLDPNLGTGADEQY